MTQKRVAIGYWGGSVRRRVQGEMTLEKIRALLQDQLSGGGLQMDLWLNVSLPGQSDIPAAGTLLCSCVKRTGEGADRRCLSCYGIRFIPGYRKFGFETIWFASISPSLTLSGLALDQKKKPNRLVLADGVLTGTAVTPDVQFIRVVRDGLWEALSNQIISDSANSSVTVEFSINQGQTWNLLSTIGMVNPQTGLIRFRVTLSRSSTSIVSPQWEILRARFATIPVNGRFGPWILALRSTVAERPIQDPRGIVTDSQNRFWTAPLSYFDSSIVEQAGAGAPSSFSSVIRDPAFIQFLETQHALTNTRWSITDFAYTEPLGYLTRQYFSARQQQPEEYTSLVF